MEWRGVEGRATGLTVGLVAMGLAVRLTAACQVQPSCENDADCVEGTVCQASQCLPPEDVPNGSTGPNLTTFDPDTSGSSTDASTSTATTSGGTTGEMADSSAGDDPCLKNSDCDGDQMCSASGSCVSLLSTECHSVAWPTQEAGRDNVVFLGSIMPTSPPFDLLVRPHENALTLAIDDFNKYATLQGGANIAWIGCDDTMGPDTAEAAAIHLRDLGVKAIVGPIFSEATRQVAENVTVPADMFLISPTATAPSLSSFDDNNLLWRVTPNDVYQGNAIIDRFTIDLGLVPANSRMLVLNKDDADGNELRDLVALDFSAFFTHIHYGDYPSPETFATRQDLLGAYGTVIGVALAAPGVTSPAAYNSPDDHYTHVLLLGTSEVETLIVTYLGAWAQNYFTFNMAIPLPRFAVSHGAVPQMEATVANLGVTPGTEALETFRPLLYQNVEGTAPNIFDAANFTAFNIRYQIAFGGVPASTSCSVSYDAGMAAILAMVTIPSGQEITGSKIAEGMAKLIDAAGTPISFGDQVPDFVQTARNALAAGNTVDLQGVSGALDWDPNNGELRADVLDWGLIGDPADPQLNPRCIYALDPEPATDGSWVSLSTGMSPCG